MPQPGNKGPGIEAPNTTPGATDSLSSADRLDSWKEIAAYFGRSVRTVQRWESERGMPVHRIPGGEAGSISALKSEIDQWFLSSDDLHQPEHPDEKLGDGLDDQSRAWHRPLLWIVGAGSITALFLTAIISRTPEQATQPGASPRFYTIETEFAPNFPSISPDGQFIAYFAKETPEAEYALYIRDLAGTESRKIGTELQWFSGLPPVWSPDSSQLAFMANGGWPGERNAYKVSVSGGDPSPVVKIPERFGWGITLSWSPNDRILIGSVAGNDAIDFLGEVDESSRKIRTIASESDPVARKGCADPRAVPGRHLYFCRDDGPPGEIVLIDESGHIVRRYGFGSHPLYSPTGHLIYEASGSIWAIATRGETFEPDGNPVMLLANSSSASISDDGSLLYLESTGQKQQLVWKDRTTGDVISKIGQPQWRIEQPSLNGITGEVLVRARNEANDNWSIWLHEPNRSVATLEVSLDGSVDRPVWHPDGERFTVTINGAAVLKTPRFPEAQDTVVVPVGMGEDASNVYVREWCPEIDCFFFNSSHGMWIMQDPLGPTPEIKPYLTTPLDETSPAISPDGRYVAYQAKRPGRNAVYVNTFPVATREILVSNEAGQPTWRADGKELFFAKNGTMLSAVPVTTAPKFKILGPPVELFRHTDRDQARGPEYAVSNDGQRILVVEAIQQPTSVVRIVHNWLGLLN